MSFEVRQIQAAKECLREAIALMARGAVEDVVRHNFTSHIYRMFPDRPRWSQRHIEGGEAGVRFVRGGVSHRGFVDNLVDSTAIEYEANLTVQTKFNTGFGQVKDYCAALINDGRDVSMIIGVLSDTVRWRAYRIAAITRPTSGPIGGEHVGLEEIDILDSSAADETAAKNLLAFLIRHLGRLGARPLSASAISEDLGFDSEFCTIRINPLHQIVDHAFEVKPAYSRLVEDLWKRFVSFVGAPGSAGAFDRAGYADELYLLTLAKLVCANVLEKQAIVGNRPQIAAILKGDFFKARGLNNLVEYDYFGWLHEPPFLDDIAAIASEMQEDLRAYDFGAAPAEDLFGQLMAQLAKRAQRLLLGQAWTPRWLARQLVHKVIEDLPANVIPRLVDMCCGSGAIVVEAVLQSKQIIASNIPVNEQSRRVQELALAITGFDIDPLPVILAKIGWVLAARDWLEPLGAFPITIPIYHADSLFAITPLSDTLEDEDGQEFHRLNIADAIIDLPRFLISPEFQGTFDAIIDAGYSLAFSDSREIRLSDTVIQTATNNAMATSLRHTTEAEAQAAKEFLSAFASTVNRLNREGRNGIWAFILRNSYRPGVVAGQFNGLVSNPPWLALSRIADNPYQHVLRRKSEQFGIRPPGPSFLHIEMATIFLLHAVDRYLCAGAKIACIVPDSVLTGYNHNPFRSAAFASATRAVDFNVEEVWRISETTFKNRGAVLLGTKCTPNTGAVNTLPGFLADESGMTPLTIYRNVQGRRSAWSEHATPAGEAGFFNPASFRQGADIMPRTLFFHELSAAPTVRGRIQWIVQPIDHQTSPFAFVVKDAKKLRDFQITRCVLPDELVYNVLTSNLLTPFNLTAPLRALLPIKKMSTGTWAPVTGAEIAAMGSVATNIFEQICRAISPTATIADVWTLIDTRGKLSQQHIMPGGYLVFTGTSGEIVCAAFAEANVIGVDRLIIDQTLNWARVDTLDEALYLSGLFNSEAINAVIRDFQPEGAFGRRHIHSLPFRATPPFEPGQALHQDVVAQTRRLISAFELSKATDAELQRALNPNQGSLARRRLTINRKLKALPVYVDYAIVCRALYGV